MLAWLGGARVVELKTVQVDDRLVIPRPCIDARTVGFNVEWSQELRVEQALEEYVAAWMLIRILQEEGVAGGPQAEDPIVFDMSVGYDLAGVGTRKVSDFVRGLQDATPVIDRLRARLTGPLARFRDLDFAPQVSAGITLSTFHGCPAGEIEGIVTTLLRELKTHTIIKLNPTLLGYDAVDGIVRGELGYEHLQLDRQAFDHDLQWDDCVAMVERLDGVARAEGRSLGVKFTNTLVVKNHDAFFPGEPTMYSRASRSTCWRSTWPRGSASGSAAGSRSRSRPGSTSGTSTRRSPAGWVRSRPAPTSSGRAATGGCPAT